MVGPISRIHEDSIPIQLIISLHLPRLYQNAFNLTKVQWLSGPPNFPGSGSFLGELVGKPDSVVRSLEVGQEINEVARVALALCEGRSHTEGKTSAVDLIEGDAHVVLVGYELVDLHCGHVALHVEVDFAHYLRVLKDTCNAWQGVLVELQGMRVMHHHFGHPLVDATVRLVPEADEDGAVVGAIPIKQINTLPNGSCLIIFLACANQMKAVKAILTKFTKLTEPHFKLTLMPKTILVVDSKGLIRCLEFLRKGCQIYKIILERFLSILLLIFLISKLFSERCLACMQIVKLSFN